MSMSNEYPHFNFFVIFFSNFRYRFRRSLMSRTKQHFHAMLLFLESRTPINLTLWSFNNYHYITHWVEYTLKTILQREFQLIFLDKCWNSTSFLWIIVAILLKKKFRTNRNRNRRSWMGKFLLIIRIVQNSKSVQKCRTPQRSNDSLEPSKWKVISAKKNLKIFKFQM